MFGSMNTSVDTTIIRARILAKRDGWSKTRLAREAGLGINGLVDLFDEDFNPTAEKLRKMELAIDRIDGHPKTSVENILSTPANNAFTGFHTCSDGAIANPAEDGVTNQNLSES